MSRRQTASTVLDLQGLVTLRHNLELACGPTQLSGETFELFTARIAAEYYISNEVAAEELQRCLHK